MNALDQASPATFRRRRRLQIHLSTAIALMITAGMLMCLNLRDADWKSSIDSITLKKNGTFNTLGPVPYDTAMLDDRVKDLMFTTEIGWTSSSFEYWHRGWPAIHCIYYTERNNFETRANVQCRWYPQALLLNACAAVGLLLGVYLVAETIMRRWHRKML
jgi:hypothetical protein